MKQQIINLINTLKEIVNEKQMAVSDSIIFEQACSFYRGELAGKNKFNKQDLKNIIKTEVDKPSEKQITELKRLNKYKEGLTKKEAWQIINESKIL